MRAHVRLCDPEGRYNEANLKFSTKDDFESMCLFSKRLKEAKTYPQDFCKVADLSVNITGICQIL